MSKLLPGSMPIFLICAMIGLIGDMRRMELQKLGGIGEIRPPIMVSTWTFGGVFMSTLGRS